LNSKSGILSAGAQNKTSNHRIVGRPVECDVGRKVEFVVERDVEQGQEIFSRRHRRIPDFSHEGVDLEQEPRLPLAHRFQVGPSGPGRVDFDGQLMVFVFELNPSFV